MTDELKNALLKSNIQCINEYDGKFVLLNTTVHAGNKPLPFKPLFSREIPVGSIFITKVDITSKNENKTSVFVCCNASQMFRTIESENNLFWYEITDNGQVISPREVGDKNGKTD